MIDAVFEHKDGYKFNIIYSTKKKFISSVRRTRDATFLHAVDDVKQVVIYPSNLYDYIHSE